MKQIIILLVLFICFCANTAIGEEKKWFDVRTIQESSGTGFVRVSMIAEESLFSVTDSLVADIIINGNKNRLAVDIIDSKQISFVVPESMFSTGMIVPIDGLGTFSRLGYSLDERRKMIMDHLKLIRVHKLI